MLYCPSCATPGSAIALYSRSGADDHSYLMHVDVTLHSRDFNSRLVALQQGTTQKYLVDLNLLCEAILHAQRSAKEPMKAHDIQQALFRCPESVPASAATSQYDLRRYPHWLARGPIKRSGTPIQDHARLSGRIPPTIIFCREIPRATIWQVTQYDITLLQGTCSTVALKDCSRARARACVA
eukprot:6195102-Pleurochrysis_carterae.AAC.1